MERYISLLLTFTSLATAKNSPPNFIVTRNEIQDSFREELFHLFDVKLDCTAFSGGTATQREDYCICDKYLTFSTENRKCISYKTDEGK